MIKKYLKRFKEWRDPRCRACKRPLRTKAAIKAGIGPDCRKKELGTVLAVRVPEQAKAALQDAPA